MRIDSTVSGIISLLAEELDGVDIVSAYPDTVILSRLERKTVAVGFGGLRLSSSSLDRSDRSGEVTVFADIFVPSSDNAGDAFEIFNGIIGALDEMCIVAVSAERLSFDKELDAYVIKTAISFAGRIETGGDGSE